MLSHDFQEMPTRSAETGDTMTLLRCLFCMKTPKTVREDGCAARVLLEHGSIVLRLWNPDGAEYFKGRKCVTCSNEIMDHTLHAGSNEYWCGPETISEGINDGTFDVAGVTVPPEPECPPQ